MVGNTVLQSTSLLIEDPRFVFIDDDAIARAADKYAPFEFQIPTWEEPVMLEGLTKDAIDFFFLGNTLNFAFTDFDTKQKYTAEYKGVQWRGSFGMWASLKRGIEEGMPLLEGEYLSHIGADQFGHLFRGNIEIPMFDERLNIFHEVGEVLSVRYGGHFHNLVDDSGHRLFNDGRGVVERLVDDFPSFGDSVIYGDRVICFDKRAQLAPAMLYGRFGNRGLFHVEDIDELTVFADYMLPKALRGLDILVYEKSLAERIDTQQLILAGSQEELELRASTIHAAKRLQDRINESREVPINALHTDYFLWTLSRDFPGPHHLTETIFY